MSLRGQDNTFVFFLGYASHWHIVLVDREGAVQPAFRLYYCIVSLLIMFKLVAHICFYISSFLPYLLAEYAGYDRIDSPA